MSNRDYIAPSYTDLRTAVFKDHPFHCSDCNKELQFENREFRYAIRQYTEIMISPCFSIPSCNICLAERIKKWFKTPQKMLSGYVYPSHRRRHKCDSCGKQKIVAHTMNESWLNIRFGIHSWNSSWICKDCLVKGVQFGKLHWSGAPVRKNGQEYWRNEVGALIPV